ncbi:MAG: response regulator [Pseudomonadota bacterium]
MSDKTKILVIDDDYDQVDAVRVVLESAGYEVVVAYDAKEGVQKAETERPDLIILDIMMPEGTQGFHFVWEIRQYEEEYFQKIPIVVLSAIHDKTDLRFYPDSSDGTYQAGEYLPVQEFLDKPARPDELLKTVKRILSTSKK